MRHALRSDAPLPNAERIQEMLEQTAATWYAKAGWSCFAERERRWIAHLLDRMPEALMTSRSTSGWDPLHSAAAIGNPGCVRRLAAHLPPHGVYAPTGATPLHVAADCHLDSVTDVIGALCAAGADVHARDDDQQTPLHAAAYHGGNLAAAEALLAHGADPNLRDAGGCTVLHAAVPNQPGACPPRRLQLIARLLHAGAQVDPVDGDQSPLGCAIHNRSVSAASLLLQHGARPVADWTSRPQIQTLGRAWTHACAHAAAPDRSRMTDALVAALADGGAAATWAAERLHLITTGPAA